MFQTPPNVVTGQHAGFASRLVAFAVDLILINFALILATAAMGTVLRYFNFDNLFFNRSDNPTELADIVVRVAGAVTFLITYFVYPIFFWVLIGQTPGKMLLGLRVTRLDGQRIGVGRAFLRVLGYWVSAICLFIGFIWILFDARRQGWHDKIAGTYVVYYRPQRGRVGLSST
jgi:uncharacterized RDD family membrane protein YckC